MSILTGLSTVGEDETCRLRDAFYNAEVREIDRVHDDLVILRVHPDHGNPSFLPGQYAVLGLGNWEQRIPGVEEEQLDSEHLRKLARRAYSFSCSMLDDQGRLMAPRECELLEFYIVLIREGEEHPPGLTPRIFALNEGDRLFLGNKVTGHYTLDQVQPDDDVIFLATGTGEAPHNAMVAELLSLGHRGQLVSLTCVRSRADLGYLALHRKLEQRFDNYRYMALSTRDPENLDPSVPGFVGKRYIQDYFDSGEFEHDAGLSLDPQTTHVFLCGNPKMIGVPVHGPMTDGQFPQPRGMVEVLVERGFQVDLPKSSGNIHFEKYW